MKVAFQARQANEMNVISSLKDFMAENNVVSSFESQNGQYLILVNGDDQTLSCRISGSILSKIAKGDMKPEQIVHCNIYSWVAKDQEGNLLDPEGVERYGISLPQGTKAALFSTTDLIKAGEAAGDIQAKKSSLLDFLAANSAKLAARAAQG